MEKIWKDFISHYIVIFNSREHIFPITVDRRFRDATTGIASAQSQTDLNIVLYDS